MIHKELSDGMVDPIQWTSPSAVQRVRHLHPSETLIKFVNV